jgi:hypothetical protein
VVECPPALKPWVQIPILPKIKKKKKMEGKNWFYSNARVYKVTSHELPVEVVGFFFSRDLLIHFGPYAFNGLSNLLKQLDALQTAASFCAV